MAEMAQLVQQAHPEVRVQLAHLVDPRAQLAPLAVPDLAVDPAQLDFPDLRGHRVVLRVRLGHLVLPAQQVHVAPRAASSSQRAMGIACFRALKERNQ